MIQKANNLRRYIKEKNVLFSETIGNDRICLFEDQSGDPYVEYKGELYTTKGQREYENYFADKEYWFQGVVDLAKHGVQLSNF